MPAAARFVDSTEKSASSMRDFDSDRFVTLDVKLSTAEVRRFCCAPRLARSVATVSIAVSSVASPADVPAAVEKSSASTPRAAARTEERRVGKEGARTCEYRWSPDHSQTKKN